MSQTSYGATGTRSTENIPPTRSSTSASQNQPSDTGSAEGLRRKAASEAESVKQRATEQQESLKRQAGEAAQAAKKKAFEAANQAKATTQQYAAEKKARVADEIGVFSGAIRKAAGKLHEENHDSIASYVDAAAEQLDEIRESLQTKDIAEIIDDVQHFARRRPEIVYGGMFVVGLAAMRFLKASRPTQRPDSAPRRRPVSRDLNDHSQRPAAAFGHQPVELTPQQAEPVAPSVTPLVNTATNSSSKGVQS